VVEEEKKEVGVSLQHEVRLPSASEVGRKKTQVCKMCFWERGRQFIIKEGRSAEWPRVQLGLEYEIVLELGVANFHSKVQQQKRI
jgi:hypothetical protein